MVKSVCLFGVLESEMNVQKVYKYKLNKVGKYVEYQKKIWLEF